MSASAADRPDLTSFPDLMQLALVAIEAVGSLTEAHHYNPTFEHAVANLGVATGFRDLDAVTGGMSRGDLWVITGLSGAGKSVLALDLIRAAAIADVATTEVYLRYDEVADFGLRLACAECRVPVDAARSGRLSDEHWTRYARRMCDIGDARISVWSAGETEESPVDAAQAIRGTARRPRLVVVDDILPETCADDLVVLRSLARELGATVVAVLSDGPIDELEHVESVAARIADLVVRVDRRAVPGTSRLADDGYADLVLVRHRRGPVARVRVGFEGFYSRFAELPEGA